MNNPLAMLITVILVLGVIGGGAYVLIQKSSPVVPVGDGTVACTADAKLCPDGSYVGRTGPKCEFAQCPSAQASTTPPGNGGGAGILPYNSGVTGTVLLGPTCPVMRDPPDPQCADKGYATTISVSRSGSSLVYATTKSDASGGFKISLPPGTYTVTAKGGNTLPRCSEETAVVGPTGYVAVSISCDTGIR